MCESCAVPMVPHYEGRELILTPNTRACSCPTVEYGGNGVICIKCGHRLKIVDTFDASVWDPSYALVDLSNRRREYWELLDSFNKMAAAL
jgi:hypothetical protein